MKSYHSAVVRVNEILVAFMVLLLWLGYGYLPGQLDGQMASDVVLTKYQVVCARLTCYLMVGYFVVLVLVNAVLLRVCLSSRKDKPAASSDA